MCCNNFGYYTSFLSQMLFTTMMVRSVVGASSRYRGDDSQYRGDVFSQAYYPQAMYSQGYDNYESASGYGLFPAMQNYGSASFLPTLNYAPYSGGGYSYTPSQTYTGNYFSFLNGALSLPTANPLPTKTYYVNKDENGVKRNPFDAFEKMEEVIDDIGYNAAVNYSDRNAGVEITNDAWRADANAGKSDVDASYMTQVKAFGKEFIKGIDAKHGNSDGVLTYEEFEKYQMEDLPADASAELKEKMKESSKIAFDRLNLNGGNTIDEKEITTLLAAMDYDNKSNVNGIITINDFMRTSTQLAQKEKNSLDTLLKDRYEAFFDKKV